MKKYKNIIYHISNKMIKKFIQTQVLANLGKFSFSGSGHHSPAPSKLQRVQQKLIYIYIRNIDGVYEKVPAFEGQSLLQTITRMQVRGFNIDLCDGYDATYEPHKRPHDPFSDGPQCGNCRVILEDNWYNRVHVQTEGMSEQERVLLQQQSINPKTNNRLACCIPIQPWMNGMTLSLDPQTNKGQLQALY